MRFWPVLLIVGAVALQDARSLLLRPEAPAFAEPAPARSVVRFETSKGSIDIEVVRAWAPRGADRFYNLARHGYYDDARIGLKPRSKPLHTVHLAHRQIFPEEIRMLAGVVGFEIESHTGDFLDLSLNSDVEVQVVLCRKPG